VLLGGREGIIRGEGRYEKTDAAKNARNKKVSQKEKKKEQVLRHRNSGKKKKRTKPDQKHQNGQS